MIIDKTKNTVKKITAKDLEKWLGADFHSYEERLNILLSVVNEEMLPDESFGFLDKYGTKQNSFCEKLRIFIKKLK